MANSVSVEMFQTLKLLRVHLLLSAFNSILSKAVPRQLALKGRLQCTCTIVTPL